MKKLLILSILLLAFPAWSATRSVGVGQTYATIALAFAAASAGDTIELCADTAGGSKTYTENNITTILDNLTIQGRAGDTITWDGSGGEYCLMLSDASGDPGEGNYPAADNVTIQNIIFTGSVQEFLVGTGWPYPGGANDTTITNCTFTGATPAGGDHHHYGIILAVLSEDFTFTNNTVSSNTDNWGLHLWMVDRFTVTGNTFTGGSYDYSALGVDAGGDDQVVNTLITDTGIISNNTFTNVNDTGDYKADGHMIGLHGGTFDSRPIQNVKISENTITSSALKSGTLIAIYNAKNVDITKNVMYDNDSAESIGVGTNCYDVGIYYNKIYSNRAIADYSAGAHSQIFISQATGGCAACDVIENIFVYNNTIFSNDDANSPSIYRAGLQISVADNAEFLVNNVIVKNNIIASNFTSAGDKGFELVVNDTGAGDITNLVLDYNDYYRSANTDYFVHYEGTDYTYAQFANYQAAKAQDANSIKTDPLVDSSGNLAFSSPAKDTGTPTFTKSQMTTLGKLVYGTIPDMGASEIVQKTEGPKPPIGGKGAIVLTSARAALSTSSAAYLQSDVIFQGAVATWQGGSVTW